MKHEPKAAQNWYQEPCGALTSSFISATLVVPVWGCAIIGVIWPLTNTGGGRQKTYRGRSKFSHFSSSPTLHFWNKYNSMQLHFFREKYLASLQIPEGHAANEFLRYKWRARAARGAVGAAGTKFKGKPAERQRGQDWMLEPAAAPQRSVWHLTSHHVGPFALSGWRVTVWIPSLACGSVCSGTWLCLWVRPSGGNEARRGCVIHNSPHDRSCSRAPD